MCYKAYLNGSTGGVQGLARHRELRLQRFSFRYGWNVDYVRSLLRHEDDRNIVSHIYIVLWFLAAIAAIQSFDA